MWVGLYIVIMIIAVVFFILGYLREFPLFLSVGAMLFLLLGYESFRLFLIDSGQVFKLESSYYLAFVWFGFAVISIIGMGIMYFAMR